MKVRNPCSALRPRVDAGLLGNRHMRNPIRPGEILLEEYLNPLRVSQNVLARSLGITPKTISEIVLGKRGI
jgi:plasmid maintenance system antidote protein VapI